MATTISGVELGFALGKKYNAVVESLSHVQLFAILWTVAHQAPLFMEFSRQEYWSELPFPIPEDIPHPGIEPKSHMSPALGVDSLPLHHLGSPFNTNLQCLKFDKIKYCQQTKNFSFTLLSEVFGASN